MSTIDLFDKQYLRSYKLRKLPLRGRTILVLVGLIAAGYAGNYFTLPMFFGVEFLFGSVAVLMVATLFGITWGTVVGFLVSLYTLVLWGHPYAIITLTLEALCVAWGLRRTTLNLVALDALYWMFLGIPLTSVWYAQLLDLPLQSLGNVVLTVAVLKIAVNGIFNALVASLLLVHTPLANWLYREYTPALPLRQTLFNLLVAFTMLPALALMAVDSRLEMKVLDTEATQVVAATGEEVAANLRLIRQYSGGDLQLLEKLLAAHHNRYPIELLLLNRQDDVIRRYPSHASRFDFQPANANDSINGLHHWMPQGPMPILVKWRQSRYYTQVSDPNLPWTVLVSLPAASIFQSLEQFYVRNMVTLLVVTNATLLLASQLSRVTLQPLAHLARVSTSLPHKIDRGEPPELPQTAIWEINAISENFQTMALALQEKFDEIQTAKANLERRVRERTQSLAQTNKALGAEITERKRIEAEIRKSQQRLSLMVSQTPLGVVEWNNKFEVVAWNPAAERIFGYAEPEALGQSIAERIVPPDLQERLKETLDDLLHQRGGHRVVNENLTKDGRRIVCDWYNTPLIDADGRCIGIASLVQDITDRKRAEAELRESEQRFRDVSNAAGEYLWEINLEGEYTFLSERVKAIKGYDAADLLGRSPLDVIYPEDRDRIQAILNHARIHQQPFKFEHRSLTPSGEVVWEEVNGVPRLDEAGNIVGFRGAGLSITNRKRAEMELRESEARLRQKAQELEATLLELQQTQSQLVQSEKMSSLGQLVAGVAHEINNPVNFIYGNLIHAEEYTEDLLKVVQVYQQSYPNPEATVREEVEAAEVDFLLEDFPRLIDSMKEGARRIREIVASLRNFSRLDEAEYKTANLHDGIDNSLMILHNRMKEKSYRPAVQVVKQYGELPLVECFAGQLNQVFMNILVNALDALEERDRYRTSEEMAEHPSQITITTEAYGDRVRVSIRDNAGGMPETVRERIFNPFFTTKPVGKGTGLGLSISYQVVVERHQGKLECFSTPGEGTEFVMHIPCKQSR